MDKSSSIGLKIIIIGDTSTGKTSIVTKYIYNKFSESYKATIVSQFDFKIIKYKDQIYRLQFWDLAGQDRSPEMTKLFCQDTNGVIICCEVNKKESRDNTLKWKENFINNEFNQCFRTSALNGFGIEDMILFIVEDIVNRNNNNNNNEINDTFKIQKNKQTTNQDNNLKKSCC